METNFFSLIANLPQKGQIQMVIRNVEQDNITVLFMFSDPQVTDKYTPVLPALSFCKPAKELDQGFFSALTSPLQVQTELLSNAKAFQEAAKQARQKQVEDSKNKQETVHKKPSKYESQLAKVLQLEEKGLYGQALQAMPKVNDFPGFKHDIKNKTAMLRKKWEDGQPANLFGGQPASVDVPTDKATIAPTGDDGPQDEEAEENELDEELDLDEEQDEEQEEEQEEEQDEE